ncbi:MAG: DUF4232 domain-containing protein [Actinomycetota bacterium]
MSNSRILSLSAAVVVLLVGASIPVAMAAFHLPGSPNDCVREQLNVRSNGESGALGTIHGAWVFENRSNDACTLQGYPDLQMFRKGGRPLPTTTKHTLAPSTRHVELDPGESATFFSSYSDVEMGSEKCRTSRVLEITAPDAGAGLFVPARLMACGGVIRVSAVEAGVHSP